MWSSIVVPPESGIDTVPISSVRMTWPAAVTKSMLLARVLLKSRQSLHRCRDAHESKNQGEAVCEGLCKPCSFTMKAVPTGPGAKGSGSESSSCLLALFSAALCAWFGVLLRIPLLLFVSLFFVILPSGIAEWSCSVFCLGENSLARSVQAYDSCSTRRHCWPFSWRRRLCLCL